MKYKFILTLTFALGHFFLFGQEQPIKAYLDSASYYRLTGDTMEVYYLTKAIQLQPQNPTLYELRAYAKSYLQKESDPNYGHKEAIKDFDIAIKLSPKNSFYYEQRGYQKYLAGQFYQATKDYNKAIRLDRKNAGAYRKRGDVFWDFQNFPQAGEDYYRASQLDTTSIYNLRKVGDCFYELGNLRNAVQFYDQAISKAESRSYFDEVYSEDYALSILYRANSNGYMGKAKEAIKDYSSVIEYNEKFKGLIDYTQEAYKFRGMAYLNIEKKEEGCKDLKMAQSLGDKEAKEYIDIYCK